MRGDQLPGRLAADPGPDLRDILDHAGIDAAYQPEVARIAGPVGLARRERKPRDDRADRVGGAEPDAGAADEVDRRRHIDRMRDLGARNPGPPLGSGICPGNPRPAPVMRRRKAPRHVVDPVPAPRCGPAPMPVAVGRPVIGHAFRDPHLAEPLGALPDAGAIERLPTCHPGRNMLERSGLHDGVGSGPPQTGEIVGSCDRDRSRRALQRQYRAGRDRPVRAATRKTRLSGKDRDPAGELVIAGGDVVIARREQPHRALRQVDLNRRAGIEPRQMNADAALL